jgi:hypothetical protein
MKRATEQEKLLADLFSDNADFRYDFELTPIHSAVLHEYDTIHSERPDLSSLLVFAWQMSNVSRKEDWKMWKWKYRDRSPQFRELIDWFEKGLESGESGEARFCHLLEQPDALQFWTPLQWAAFVDREKEFALLIKIGADPFKITPSGRNVLHQAAESGTSGVITYLLSHSYHEKGVDIDLHDIWGETPLHIAAAKGSDSATLLLQHGASVQASQSEHQVLLTQTRYLSGEERLKSVDILSKQLGSHINARDIDGRPPIMHLLESAPCVELLLERGADILVRDNNGRNITHHACIDGFPQILLMLLSKHPEKAKQLAE